MQLPGQVGSLDVSAKLDPREEYFRSPSSVAGLHLSLRYLPPQTNASGAPKLCSTFMAAPLYAPMTMRAGCSTP
jgi:hypothetical protein